MCLNGCTDAWWPFCLPSLLLFCQCLFFSICAFFSLLPLYQRFFIVSFACTLRVSFGGVAPMPLLTTTGWSQYRYSQLCSHALTRCMGAAILYLGWLSLAGLYRVFSRFIDRLSFRKYHPYNRKTRPHHCSKQLFIQGPGSGNLSNIRPPTTVTAIQIYFSTATLKSVKRDCVHPAPVPLGP